MVQFGAGWRTGQKVASNVYIKVQKVTKGPFNSNKYGTFFFEESDPADIKKKNNFFYCFALYFKEYLSLNDIEN